MGLLTSRLTARRFVVEGDLPDQFREAFRDGLQDHAYNEPPGVHRELEGWTCGTDIMDTDFGNFNSWFFNNSWLLFSLRIDKRMLPAAKFKAELKLRCKAWAEERSVERCPASVRSELKEMLENEWLPRQMPKTTMHEVAWNIDTNMLYLSSHAEGVGDRFRKRFYRTFGRTATPMPPMFWVEDDSVMDALLTTAPMIFRGGAK